MPAHIREFGNQLILEQDGYKFTFAPTSGGLWISSGTPSGTGEPNEPDPDDPEPPDPEEPNPWRWPFKYSQWVIQGNSTLAKDSQYGLRENGSFHNGLDFGVAGIASKPVKAAYRGKVIRATNSDDIYGTVVDVQHGPRFMTRYGHMENNSFADYDIHVGDWIPTGKNLGRVGATGVATGNHLHFGTFVNGATQNPRTFMKNRGYPQT